MGSTKMSGCRVRPATADDIEEILALEREIPSAPHWVVASYQACLADDGVPRRRLLVAEAEGDGRMVGFIVGKVFVVGDGLDGGLDCGLEGVSGEVSRNVGCDAIAEIESVAVSPSVRRQGSGSMLCCAMLDWFGEQQVKVVYLEVRVSSAAAIGLYESLGFQREGVRRRYYRDPVEDALAMRLDRKADRA